MSFFLRLGCALLASVGIAAAPGAVSPADAAAAHAAQERLAEAPAPAVREDASHGVPDGSVRAARGSDHAVRTAAAAPNARPAASLASLRVSSPFFLRVSSVSRRSAASPRGPPASA